MISLAIDEQLHAATLIALFRRTVRIMIDELVTRLQAAGYTDVTAAHHPVFENIDPGGTRLTTLAARAGMTHQSMSELVTALARNDYLERTLDPSDGRVRIVRLTSKGRRLARRAVAEISAIETTWIDRFKAGGLNVEMSQILQHGLNNDEHTRAAP